MSNSEQIARAEHELRGAATALALPVLLRRTRRPERTTPPMSPARRRSVPAAGS